ncbi:hypothetical protein [Zobellia laminariae]|uniref:hypothetical protein n=1 Tax=Zobellia laminariae TaxID=248906 RepID=UPI0026F429D2|nr:hypothetical protein [Zobellia laminariae]WKX76703.1 hypothetical protein Q5W13_00550 [Zobellia laminariae]
MDINTTGSIASIIGLVISVITMLIVVFVNRKVKKLQISNLFDQRINKHLTTINTLQQELNSNMPNIVANEIRIKEILVQLMTEFESLFPKLQDKRARRKTNRVVKCIQGIKNKGFYNTEKTDVNMFDRFAFFYEEKFSNMVSSRKILNIYILINENYNRIQQVKLDKNALKK